MKTNKSFLYWQWRTIIVTMIGYALFYFVRKNFSFAIPGLSAEYGITKTSFGIIMTLVTVVYGISRFLNGFMADRMNARYHMAVGLLLCAIANYAFGFGADISALITGDTSGPQFTNMMVLVFGIILLLNNFFQGSGFPPCARLLSHWIPANELATKMSVWNTSHSVGASIVAILCGYVMGTMGVNMAADPDIVASIAANLHVDASDAERWQSVIESASHYGAWRMCFWIPATIALAGSVFIFAFLRDTPSSVGLQEIHTVNKKGSEGGAEYKEFLRRMVFRNRWIWILAISNFLVYIVRFAVLDWGPTFLKEARGMSLAHAGWTVAVFEIFGILGTLFFGWITDPLATGPCTSHLPLLHGGRGRVHGHFPGAALTDSSLDNGACFGYGWLLHLWSSGSHRHCHCQSSHQSGRCHSQWLCGSVRLRQRTRLGYRRGYVR